MRATRWLPLLFFLFVWTLTTHGKYSVSGDEPHYLIVAHSLVADGDFDVANNYAQNDGQHFGHDGLKPEQHARTNRWSATWSVHDPGLPLLVAPVYAAASALAGLMSDELLARTRQSRGLFAYSLVSLAILALSAWGVSLFLAGLLRDTAPRLALAVTGTMAFVPPFLAHAFLVFPDIVAGVVTCAVVWLWCQDSRDLALRRVLPLALAIGLLPWLHRRYLLLGLGLVFVAMHRHGGWVKEQRTSTKLVLAAALVVPAAGLFLLMWVAWGHLGGPQAFGPVLSAAWIPRGSLGLILDRERGLLAYSPIYLLIPACWIVAWRRHWPAAIAVALAFLPAAAFLEWFAGFAPAARYLVPVIPLLVLPARQALESRRLWRVWVVLGVFQTAICLYVWQKPRTLWPAAEDHGSNAAVEAIPLVGQAYSRALPSVYTGDSLGYALAVAAALAVATALVVRFSRSGARQL